MLTFKSGEVPDFEFKKAIKKPIPVRCLQINEPFRVETLEGVFDGKAGDYLMVGTRGEMYPCEQSIFYETYDLI